MHISIETGMEDSSMAPCEDQKNATLSTLLASKQTQTGRERASPCFLLLLLRVNSMREENAEMQHHFSEGFHVR